MRVDVLIDHLIINEINKTYTCWIYDREENFKITNLSRYTRYRLID